MNGGGEEGASGECIAEGSFRIELLFHLILMWSGEDAEIR